jgi:AcrR family transcriptional regulator
VAKLLTSRSMAIAAARRQRLGHDERREQILACARRLFSERVYAAVSTSDIAADAGVARGLLHHYFGTKRELYLEVVRSIVADRARPFPSAIPRGSATPEQAIVEVIDRWLTMIERNRGTWLASHGAQGLGRDPELEQILDEARERAVDALIAILRPDAVVDAPPELRATLRAYGGFAEAASIEWLERERVTREQLVAMLVTAFWCSAGSVLDAVRTAGGQISQVPQD